MIFLLLACDPQSKVQGVNQDTAQVEEEPPVATWEDISEALSLIQAESEAPAMGAARLEGGEVTHMGTVGLRSASDSVEVTDWDKWHLGSCTKAMTATLFGTFADEGLVSWDSTMAELFPTFDLHPDYESVTVEMMLSHTGGTWGSLTEHSDVWSLMREEGNVIETRELVAETVLSEAPEAAPGTIFLYSNVAYMIVGSALERLSGQSWEDLMQQRIFDPLDMGSCGFGAPDPEGTLEHPWGHYNGEPVDGAFDYADNPTSLGPAGTVHCSLLDWSKFVSEQMKAYRGESTILSTAQSQQLFETQLNNYAMGWGVVERSWADGVALNHSGSNTMNMAVVWAAPELDVAFMATANASTDSVYMSMDEAIVMMLELD